MTLEELKAAAAEVAQGLTAASAPEPALRKRFLAVRAELFRRGIFDPILSRFDSATVPPPSMQQIAEQLRAIAGQIQV